MYREASVSRGEISSVISQNIVITLLQCHSRRVKRHFRQRLFFKGFNMWSVARHLFLSISTMYNVWLSENRDACALFYAQVNFTLTRKSVGVRLMKLVPIPFLKIYYLCASILKTQLLHFEFMREKHVYEIAEIPAGN